MLMLMGAMVRDLGTPGTGALEMLTSGGAPMSFFASRLGPVSCHDVVSPARRHLGNRGPKSGLTRWG